MSRVGFHDIAPDRAIAWADSEIYTEGAAKGQMLKLAVNALACAVGTGARLGRLIFAEITVGGVTCGPIFDFETSTIPRISMNLHRRHLNESQRAMIAAKLVSTEKHLHKKPDVAISISDAAGLLNVSRAAVDASRVVLTRGTKDEIEGVERGAIGLDPLARKIRKGDHSAKRAKARNTPLSQVGRNPERIQNQRINAEIWARIRDAITNLNSLPSVSVAPRARRAPHCPERARSTRE